MTTDRVHNNTVVQSHHSGSSAEQTIIAHFNPEAMVNKRPLVVKKDGYKYPSNPTNGYVSRWRDGFFGCLGCGSDNHRFVSCSKKNDLDSRSLFWQELWDHVPSTRKRASEPICPSLLHSNLTGKSNVATNTNSIHINTLNSSRKRTNVDKPEQKKNNTNKEARWCAIFVHVNNVLSNPKNPMPIGINNSLPSISFILGILEDEENKMRMLVDTGAAMNTGNFDFHM